MRREAVGGGGVLASRPEAGEAGESPVEKAGGVHAVASGWNASGMLTVDKSRPRSGVTAPIIRR